MFEQAQKNMRQNFVGAIADKNVARCDGVMPGDGGLEQVGVRVWVEAQRVIHSGAYGGKHQRAGAVGILVGVQLDQIGKLGLLTRHVRREAFDDIAPEGGHGRVGNGEIGNENFGDGIMQSLLNSVSQTAMRQAEVSRNTLETRIRVAINLDGAGQAKLATGVGFFDHMLDQIARHGMLDLTIEAAGDLHIDAHHTVEDVGITLGQALAKALGDKQGLRRYGHAYVPLDEALSRVVVDLSGRPGLVFNVPFTRAMIGEFDVDLIHEFFQGLVNHAGISLHIDNLSGVNAHHQAETVFKAFARALRVAVEADTRAAGTIPSTKGAL